MRMNGSPVAPGQKGWLHRQSAPWRQDLKAAAPTGIQWRQSRSGGRSHWRPAGSTGTPGDYVCYIRSSSCHPGRQHWPTANGLETAKAVLMLNTLLENGDQPGGVYLTEGLDDETPVTGSLDDLRRLISRMNNGEVQTLFIHGINPLFELPPMLGSQRMQNVPQVISFASFPDETAISQRLCSARSHQPGILWLSNEPGWQRPQTISAAQPVVSPMYNTRATADVLIEAARAAGAGVSTLNYTDEVDFIQQKLEGLVGESGGNFKHPSR
jgi:anaerobic selenocysteine-containing dehydrogenase